MLDNGLMYSNENMKMENLELIPNSQDKLMDAALVAMDTGDITPLVKEELKLTIQSRRLAAGVGELQVQFEPPQERELTEDEKEKVDRRREQNRLAAQRFRQKQKLTGARVQKKVRSLESDNTRLRTELKILQTEREILKRQLDEHMKICPGQILHMFNT